MRENEAKKYLQSVAIYDRRINAKLEEIAQLKAMVLRITPVLTGDVGSGSGNQDKIGNTMAKIIDLQAEINAEIDKLVDLKRAVGHMLDRLEDDKKYAVLHKRYIQYKTWEQIATEMNYTYRWVCIVHGKALIEFEKIMKDGEEHG